MRLLALLLMLVGCGWQSDDTFSTTKISENHYNVCYNSERWVNYYDAYDVFIAEVKRFVEKKNYQYFILKNLTVEHLYYALLFDLYIICSEIVLGGPYE